MKTLYENDSEDVIEGVMAISGHGTALSVFPYEDDWRYCGYNYDWGDISDGTVFDAKKVKTLDDIDRYYSIGVFTSKERTEKSGTRLVAVTKTVKTYTKIVEKE